MKEERATMRATHHAGEKLGVLSLFSGCGGMDLGFEGGFCVPKASINRDLHPDWCESEAQGDWIKLQG